MYVAKNTLHGASVRACGACACLLYTSKSGAYYEKAVAWAVENKVTTGTSATTFSPDALSLIHI